MLCNIYVKEPNQKLMSLGINSSSPIFFVNLPDSTISALKASVVKDEMEVYLIQEDPYLKNLSNMWINGGVQLPEIKIVERIVHAPAKVVEKTLEVEVIKEVEVEVIKEVIKEVIVYRDAPVLNESKEELPVLETVDTPKKEVVEEDEDEGILIDTKVAFEDWKSKNVKPKTIVDKLDEALDVIDEEEEDSDTLDIPEVVEDPLEEDTSMPILLVVDEEPETVDVVVKPKRGRKKKVVEPVVESFDVELTEEEIKEYETETEE